MDAQKRIQERMIEDGQKYESRMAMLANVLLKTPEQVVYNRDSTQSWRSSRQVSLDTEYMRQRSEELMKERLSQELQ